MNKLFKKDYYRYYKATPNLVNCIKLPLEVKWQYYFRMCGDTKKWSIKGAWSRLRLRHLSVLTQIQIPYSTNIGEGFYIGHRGRIIINPGVVIGKNCNIATGVTIGQENRGKRKGCPTISDSVWIGANAVIVGNINVGSDVLIAPLTFVNFDVPNHSIVAGNPAHVVSRENATYGYINNKV